MSCRTKLFVPEAPLINVLICFYSGISSWQRGTPSTSNQTPQTDLWLSLNIWVTHPTHKTQGRTQVSHLAKRISSLGQGNRPWQCSPRTQTAPTYQHTVLWQQHKLLLEVSTQTLLHDRLVPDFAQLNKIHFFPKSSKSRKWNWNKSCRQL